MAIPSSPGDFTNDWLEQALSAPPGSLKSFECTAIGTGQIAASYRIALDWRLAGEHFPASIVAKCTSPDETSVDSARLLNLYVKEVNWYRELAPSSTVRVPECFYSDINRSGDRFVLLLEDCAPGRQGDQLAGASIAQVRAALDEAARLHAPFLHAPCLSSMDWLAIDPDTAALRRGFIGRFWPAFRQRYRGRLADELLELGDTLVQKLMAAEEEPPPDLLSIVHGDFRIDNMLFGAVGGRAVVLDWQTVYTGHPLADVSYLIGTSVADPALRKKKEQGLVRYYCERMAARGVDLAWDLAWTNYRRHATAGFLMAVTASMLAKRTERGDEMFAVMAERPARQMMDLDTIFLY